MSVALGACAGNEERPVEGQWRQPNVVLIIIDTLRADALGAYGLPLDVSPEIDQLATEGVRFSNVIAPCTWTRPSSGAMLTGLYPRQLGLYTEEPEALPTKVMTLAEELQAAGYSTVGATANPQLNSYYGFDQGFDFYLNSNVAFTKMPSAVAPKVRGDSDAWLPTARDLLEYLLGRLTETEEHPYYVQVNLMDVHEFHDSAIGYGEPFDSLYGEIENWRRRRYLQSVRYVSTQISWFLERLLLRPGFKDTLVVITSDHGETLGDHPALAEPTWHGWLVYESQTRVPLIFYSTKKRLPRGLVIHSPVRLLDLMPTILDIVGLNPSQQVVGVSLGPLLHDPSSETGHPDAFVVETHFREADKLAAYAPGWKYIENRDNHEGTAARELQPVGARENGVPTDESLRQPTVLEALSRYLKDWEQRYPVADVTPPEGELSQQEADQLKAIGYLEPGIE